MSNLHTRQGTRDRPDPEAASNRNSCLLLVVIYVVLTVIYTLVLQTQVTAFALPLALGLAVFGTLFLGSLVSTVVWPGEVRWVLAALRRVWPEDGAVCAFSGRLVGEASPAPISGEPALAWSVDASRKLLNQNQNSSRKVMLLKAMGRVPMTLEGPAGRVVLSGLIELERGSEQSWPVEDVRPAILELRARDGAEPFVARQSVDGSTLDDFASSDDSYEKVRFRKGARVMSDDLVEERVLQPGQEVCVFGIFDRGASTLRGRRVLGVERIQVMRGGPRQVVARLMRKTLLSLLAMFLLALLSHGLIAAVVFGL